MPPKLKSCALLFFLQFTWNTYCIGQQASVNSSIDSLPIASNCSCDSINYKAISVFLDTNDYSHVQFEVLYYTVLNPEKRVDPFCSLLTYTKIFDFLLIKGLDVKYNIIKNPPLMNSIGISSLTDHTEMFKKIYHNNLQYKLFEDFLLLKKTYETDVIKAYRSNKTLSLETDVLNIIHFGTYTNPIILQNILLSKYELLTHERMVQECEGSKNKR